MDDLKSCVDTLAKRAACEHEADKAMKFAQAAQNLANAYATLESIEIAKASSK